MVLRVSRRLKKKLRVSWETLRFTSPTTTPFFFVANRAPILFMSSTQRNGCHCQLRSKSWVIKPVMVFPFPLVGFGLALNIWPRYRQWDWKEGQQGISREDFLTLEKEALEELISFHLCCFNIWMWCLEQLQPFETWRKPAWGERLPWWA